MRRRLAFVSSLVALALVVVLPGSTLAASYTYAVRANYCSRLYGGYGHGAVYLQVKMTEYGWSGANKLTLTGTAQHRRVGATLWRTDQNFGSFVKTFANDGTNHSLTRWFEYHPADSARHRIKVVAQAWDSGTLLASRTIFSDAC